MPRKRTVPLAEHFWSKVRKTSKCWIWQAARRPKGYGTYYINRVPMLAHRVAWELTYGPIEPGLDVCHHCDNPPCVRPEHLFLGTQGQNYRDAQTKGRAAISLRVRGGGRAIGERVGSSKLTSQEVVEIRRAFATGSPNLSALGRRFGISAQSVRAIVTRQTWRHVP